MRKLTTLLAAWALAVAATPTIATELPRRLRVLTYNIHHGEGADGRVDLERLAGVIRGAQPHVAALQEIDQGVRRTAGIDMPAELARLTGMKPAFGRNIDHDGGGYGTLVLTSLPIKGNELHRLPSHYAGEQRGVQALELGAGDDTIVFCNTHLDYRPEDHERLASVEKINAVVAPFHERPMLLAGDLNANPDSAVLAAFEHQWQRANSEPLPTFPAATPTKQIDYILVRPAERWRTIEARVLDEPTASDHAPLLVELERVD